MVDLARDQFSGLEGLYRRFGPVCRLGGYTYLLGPEANQFVFAHSELFSWREAFDVLVPVDGETAMIVSDARRSPPAPPARATGLHSAAIDGYVAIMATHARKTVDSWHPGSEIDLYQEFRRAIRHGTITALFGERLAADEPVFGAQLQIALDLLDQSPLLLPIRKNLPAYKRAITAREKVRDLVQTEVDRRRSADEDSADVLTALVRGRDEDGSGLSDLEIADQVISLIAAGYETTSAAMAWATRAVLVDPAIFEQRASRSRRRRRAGRPRPDRRRPAATVLSGQRGQ
ncbi:cytochrome P450 [Fodinicola feengrottensis]|uniref:cytochrome P450 n=1 Tax=Fodinicola feengrottensis TaxID=435914 RepID=UPI0013D7EAAD|nr:cytochrome P450 [Fodinicola feengrottensis]